MAENKKSVLLYCDIIHTVKSLTDEEAGKLFKHYMEYINDLNPVSDRLTELLFEPIKQNLKRDLKKWESKSERNSLIAKEGWKKRKDANASERIKPDAKHADKDTVTVKDTVTDTVKVKVKEKDIITIPKKKSSVHSEIKESFESFYKEKKGEEYYWTAKDATKVKPLLKKLEFKIKKKHGDDRNLTDQDYVEAFNYFLSKISDNWILENLSMAIIDSKFNEIITANGKQSNNSRPQPDEIIEAVLRRNANRNGNGSGI